MRVGIVGEPQSGKSVLLSLLRNAEGARRGKHDYEAVVPVPDVRVQWLGDVYQPRKLTLAELEFADLGADPRHAGVDLAGLLALPDLATCDGLAVVLDHFSGARGEEDVSGFELATAVADLDRVERRLDRLTQDRQRGNKEGEAEMPLLERLRAHLESEQPLRTLDLADDELARLRGYQFLSLKPVIVVANLPEDAAAMGPPASLQAACERAGHELCSLSLPLESELAALDHADRAEFMAELGLETPGLDRFIRTAYEGLGLISFLTVGPDECRAWSVRGGATAPEAAGKIHSDLQRGFIRAEVVEYSLLHDHGDMKSAKAAGVVRLEGKDYVVQDGDVMEIRFSV